MAKYQPGDNYLPIIEKLQLTDADKQLMHIQWINEMNYADNKAVVCKRYHTFIRLIVFIAGVIIPILSNTKFEVRMGDKFTFSNLTLITILGVVVAIGIGLNQILKYEDRWNLYRRNAELLKNEGENFIGLGGAYHEAADHQHAFRDFNTNIASIKRQDVSNYFEKVLSKEKTKA